MDDVLGFVGFFVVLSLSVFGLMFIAADEVIGVDSNKWKCTAVIDSGCGQWTKEEK